MAYNLESIDTNIVLRLLLNDNPRQTALVRKLLLIPDTKYFLDDAAIAESVYVLHKTLHESRDTVSKRLNTLFDHKKLDFDRPLLSEIIPFWTQHPKLSWNDCYLAAKTAQKQAEPLWTFDHKFAVQSPTAKLVN